MVSALLPIADWSAECIFNSSFGEIMMSLRHGKRLGRVSYFCPLLLTADSCIPRVKQRINLATRIFGV